MKRVLVLLLVAVVIAAPAVLRQRNIAVAQAGAGVAQQFDVDYTNPFFENGQLIAADWSVPWLRKHGPLIDTAANLVNGAGNKFNTVFKNSAYDGNHVCNGEYYAVKWFQIPAGTLFTVSSDYTAVLPNVAGEFKVLVYTSNSVQHFTYDSLSSFFKDATPVAGAQTNYGTTKGPGATRFTGSFATDAAVSQGYVCIVQKNWSYYFGTYEYKGQWGGSIHNTILSTLSPSN